MTGAEFASDWIGAPYRLGGSERGGVDCWGLAVAWARDVLGLSIPALARRGGGLRASLILLREQEGTAFYECAEQVAHLALGRVRGKRTPHVGILFAGRYLHAASERGVVADRKEDFAKAYEIQSFGRFAL
jgi:cell wall-associated NlpC family hydrolase